MERFKLQFPPWPASLLSNMCPDLNPSPAEPGHTLLCKQEEANWSGSALFAIKYVNLYQQFGSSNLIGWKLEVGIASYLFRWQRLKGSIEEIIFAIYAPNHILWILTGTASPSG